MSTFVSHPPKRYEEVKMCCSNAPTARISFPKCWKKLGVESAASNCSSRNLVFVKHFLANAKTGRLTTRNLAMAAFGRVVERNSRLTSRSVANEGPSNFTAISDQGTFAGKARIAARNKHRARHIEINKHFIMARSATAREETFFLDRSIGSRKERKKF